MTDTTPQIGSTIRIPIAELTVDANIRKVTKVPTSFASSVKQHGVMVPVEAYQVDGTWHLGDGQLRYLASLDAGLLDIPAIVTDPALAESTRLLRQLILNEHRTEISDADRAGTYQTLFDLGVSADQIARKANKPKRTVERALAVTGSASGAASLEQGVTLDQAAEILEFEDDPEITAALTEVAATQPEKLQHHIATARQAREEAARRAETVAEVELRGITVVEPGDHMKGAVRLDHVYTDAKLKNLAAEDDLKGHVIALLNRIYGWINEEWRPKFVPEYFVNPVPDGFFVKTTAAEKAPLTEDELAARREVRENNKAWPLATTVRQTWITDTLLQGKLPSDVTVFLATSLCGEHPKTGQSNGRELASKWLNLGDPTQTSYTRAEPIALELADQPQRAELIALAVAVGRAEAAIHGKEGWRVHYSELRRLATYLRQLEAWGYGLAPIEEQLITKAEEAAK